jgi:hypothetical protein
MMPNRTNSYCERCGTRYVFCVESDTGEPLKQARMFARGIRNLLLPEDDVDGSTRRGRAAGPDKAQVDEAFRRTFNFCLTCRMYACAKCWNAGAGACRTCAPAADDRPVAPQDHLIVRTPATRPGQATDHGDGKWLFPDILAAPAESSKPPVTAWPARDLERTQAPASMPEQQLHPTRDVDAWPTVDLEAPVGMPAPEEPAAEHHVLDGRPAPDIAAVSQIRPAAPAEVPAAAPDAVPTMATAQAEELQPAAAPESLEAFLLRASGLPSAAAASEPAPTIEPAAPALEVVSEKPAPTIEPPRPVAVVPVVPVATAQEPVAAVPLVPVVPVATAQEPAVAEPTAPPEPAAAAVPAAGTREGASSQVAAMARLIGRVASASGVGRSNPAPVPSDPWPKPTPWMERPIRPRNWTYDAIDDSELPEPEPLSVAAREPQAVIALPEAATATPVVEVPPAIEMTAAAVELPAIVAATTPAVVYETATAAEPATAEATADAAAAERAVSEALVAATVSEQATAEAAAAEPEAEASAEPAIADTVTMVAVDQPEHAFFEVPTVVDDATPRPKPPALWPPLRSRWPVREAPGKPWPLAAAPNLPHAARLDDSGRVTQMWAESSEEVFSRGTVRVCHHCSLPVSTQARFCRRCGTRQA